MPNRMNPIARYLFALSAMIVAYTAYVRVAVPYLEGPSSVSRRKQVAVEPLDNSDTLDKSHLQFLVPPESWELGTCNTLLTPQGTVYFKTWEPVDDQGNYLLEPFTMVMNDPVNRIRDYSVVEDPTEKKPAPIVLRALDGARLKFSKPLTARSKDDDIEMESAQLDGQVTVYRPANTATEEDELRVVTRNIQVNRSHIFTLADVYFSFGAHHGSGRNLSIQLAHKTDADTPTKSFSNIEGVEQMELAFVSELVLQPANASTFSPRGKTPASTLDAQQPLTLSNQKTPLRLSCDGPFVFRMGEQKAWFRENVVVTQLDKYQDNLHCESLQIDFEKGGTEATSVRNLVAIGTPEKPATVTSVSQHTIIVGEELNFDVPNSIVTAAGLKPVSIRSPTFAFEAPDFKYELVENGKLGPLVASGPGILRGAAEDGKRTFQVQWDRQLTTSDFDAQRVKIDIDGSALVNFDDQNRIEADEIDFLVWQQPAVDSTEDKPTWQYTPSQLETRGNVRIAADRLHGTARTFVANWPEPTTNRVGRLIQMRRHTVSYRAKPQEPDDMRSLPTFRADGDVVKPRPMRFSGDEVIANVAGDMDNLQIRDLVVNGSLFLKNDSADRRPFEILGTSMKLVPQTKELYRVTIEGDKDRPAIFKTDGFDLNGTNLQLDQTANTIWVQGTGNLAIDAHKQTQGRNSGDEKLPQLEKANVSWHGGMVFDGAKIYFESDVELHANRRPNSEGESSTIKTNSEALTIELTDSIRFEKVDQSDSGLAKRNEPEIRRMVFVNRLEPGNRAFRLASHQRRDDFGASKYIGVQNANVDANGKVNSLQKLFVPMATVDAVTGDIATSGPGAAMSYQYSKGESQTTGFSQSAPTGEPQAGDLTCVHVKFDGELIANSERGTMEIDRNTRTAWGKVDRFDRTLDPDRPDQLPLGAAVLKSDVLKFAQWTPRNSEPRLEMKAEGNTSIRSQLFEAVADRLTYNDDTDLLVIEGNPPAMAKLSHRKSPRGKIDTMVASKVKYNLSDNSARGENIRSVKASLPSGK